MINVNLSGLPCYKRVPRLKFSFTFFFPKVAINYLQNKLTCLCFGWHFLLLIFVFGLCITFYKIKNHEKDGRYIYIYMVGFKYIYKFLRSKVNQA